MYVYLVSVSIGSVRQVRGYAGCCNWCGVIEMLDTDQSLLFQDRANQGCGSESGCFGRLKIRIRTVKRVGSGLFFPQKDLDSDQF